LPQSKGIKRSARKPSRRYVIVDGHAHLGPREIGEEYVGMKEVYSATELIQSLDANGIDMAFVWAMRQSDDYTPANTYIAKAAKANPDRLVPFVRLNPWLENSAELLERSVLADGVKGLKLHPADECFDADDTIVHPLLEVAEKRRIPVVLHSGVTARPAIIGMAADRFPSVKMVLLHLGTSLYQDCMFVAKKCDNVFLETSQCPYLHRISRMLVDKVGADRVLWGSDIPYHYEEIEKRKVELAGLREDEMRLVMGENALRLVNMSTK